MYSSPTRRLQELIDFEEELSNPGYVFPMIEACAFVDHLLPPLRHGVDVKNIVSMLRKKGHIDSTGRWKDFRGVSGGKRRKKSDCFAPLVDIFEKATSVASAKASHLEQVLEMVLIPERSKDGRGSGSRGSTSSETACFVLKDREEQTAGASAEKRTISSWFDIALTAGLRRTSSQESCVKNARKIVSNIQLAMVRDPGRRFSFGITVENTSMRLWFCSRASPVVSKPFDFSKDLDLLFHVFLSLAFASKEELGWDTTVRPFTRRDGSRAYRIDVGDEIYETLEVVSKSSADELVGHSTRVWIVHRQGSDVPRVLKDVWIEEDQKPEHFIREILLHEVKEKYGAEARQEMASHLLTPVAHCLVRVNGKEDHTGNVMMRGYTPTFKDKYRVNVENLGKCNDDDMNPSTEIGIGNLRRGNLKDPLNWYNPVRRILHRKHYRIVFEEVAESLRAVQNMADAFTVLSDSTKDRVALKFIHGAGWVHRDLSVGNLYLYEGRGLIGDLEYAKQKNYDAEHELLTGTPHFMAVEAAVRYYSHLPPVSKANIYARLKALQEHRMEDLAKLQEARLSPSFFHNDLHDLESLWWIAIWELFHQLSSFQKSNTDVYDRERDEQRRLAFLELFPRSSKTTSRTLFLRVNFHYHDYLLWLPDHLRSIKAALDTIRTTLVHKYVQFEAAFPNIRMELLEGIHDEVHGLFGRCRDLLSGARPVSCRKAHRNRGSEDVVSSDILTRSLQRQDEERREHVTSNAPISDLNNARADNAGVLSRGGKRERDENDETLVTIRPPQRTR
ncbi:hypothetical protein ACEPAH_3078 [Sanghuangporus vaninii]